MATKSELLMESKTKVVVDISTLFKIFIAGFDFGVNDGPIPEKKGMFDAFHDLIEGKDYDGNGTRYNIADRINIAE